MLLSFPSICLSHGVCSSLQEATSKVVSPTRPSSLLDITSACRYFRYVNRLEPFFCVIREAAPVVLHFLSGKAFSLEYSML